MKTYKNEMMDDFKFWQLNTIRKDFFGYAEAMGLGYDMMTVKSYSLPKGKVVYIRQEDEDGFVLYWNEPHEADGYLVPDSIEVDIESGMVSSDRELTVYVLKE